MRLAVVRERFALRRHRHGLRVHRQRIRSCRHIAVVRILGFYLHTQGPRIGNAGRCGAPGFAAIRAIADRRAGAAVAGGGGTQGLPVVGLARIIRRDREIASLVDGQRAIGDRDIIVGYRRVTLLDRDLICVLAELRGIGSDLGLALRIVVTIGHVNLSGDAITGKQTGDGVFFAIRSHYGLGLTVIGMARAIGRNGQRNIVIDRDDVRGFILNDRYAAAFGYESAERRSPVFTIEAVLILGSSIHFAADLGLAGLGSRHLRGGTLEIVVDGVLRLVKLEIELQRLRRIYHARGDGQRRAGVCLHKLVGTIQRMRVVVVVVGEHGIADSGRHGGGKASVLRIGAVVTAGAIEELHVHRRRPVGQVFEGDHVVARVGADDKALHRDGGIVGHVLIHNVRGRILSDALNFLANFNRLGFQDFRFRFRALDDILHRVAGIAAHGVDEGDLVFCRVQLQINGLLRRVRTVALDAQRGLRNLLSKDKGCIGHGLCRRKHVAALIHIVYGIGEGVHRPMGVERHILRDGLVRIEALAALRLGEPAEEGVALAGRGGNLRHGTLGHSEGVGYIIVIVFQAHILFRRCELGIKDEVVGRHFVEGIRIRTLRVDIPTIEAVVCIQTHRRRGINQIVVLCIDVLLEADSCLGCQRRRSIEVLDLIRFSSVIEVIIRYIVFSLRFLACVCEAIYLFGIESTRRIGFLTILFRVRIFIIVCVLEHVVKDNLRALLPDCFIRRRRSVISRFQHLRREIETLGDVLCICVLRIPAVESGTRPGDIVRCGPLGRDILTELRGKVVLGALVLRSADRDFCTLFVDVKLQRVGVQHILRLNNRRAICPNSSRSGLAAIVMIVLAVCEASRAIRSGNFVTDGSALHAGADIVEAAFNILLQIDHRIVHRSGFPLGVNRRVRHHGVDGRRSLLRAFRIQIPTSEGVALAGGSRVKRSYSRCGRRVATAGMGMRCLAAVRIPASIPWIASTIVFTIVLDIIRMRMLFHPAAQHLTAAIHGLAVLSVDNHTLTGIRRLGIDIAAAHGLIGEGDDFGLIVDLRDVLRILDEGHRLGLDEAAALKGLGGGIDLRAGRADQTGFALGFHFGRAILGEADRAILCCHPLHDIMADLILRVRAGIGDGVNGLSFRERVRLDGHLALVRVVILLLIGYHRRRDDLIVFHVETAHAVRGVVVLEILTHHRLGNLNGFVACQNVLHLHGEYADVFKDGGHGHIPGDGRRLVHRVAV